MQKQITRFLKYGTLLCTYLLIASVLLQIFARFFLTNTPPWTEEASRLFFIYAMAFAAGLAWKGEEYVALDLVYKKLTPTLKKGVGRLVQAFILVLFGIMAIYGLQFVQLGILEQSPSMKIPMAFAFGSMVLMGLGICYYVFLDLRKSK